MRLALLGCVLAAGLLYTDPISAQIQPGGPYLGGPNRHRAYRAKRVETPEQVRLKTAACNGAANRYKLRGDARKKYLDECMSLTYTGKDFKPPDKPS